MIRLVIKLAIAGLLANAAWRVGSEYINFYSFQDEIRSEAARNEGDDDALIERIVELASERDLPVDPGQISVTREERRVVVEGSYVKPIPVLPSYAYPWPFSWSVDAYVVAPAYRPR